MAQNGLKFAGMNTPTKKKRSFKPKNQKSTLLEFARAFSTKDRPNQVEINIFRDLFYSLVPKTSPEDLDAISSILASSSYTPRPVAMYFAMESLHIASPFLLFSPVLNNSDMIAIASNRPHTYADVIKRRDNISEPLAKHLDELKKPGDVEKQNIAVSSNINSTVKLDENKNVDLSSELISLANKGGRLEHSKQPANTTIGLESFERDLLEKLRNSRTHDFKNSLAQKTGLSFNVISEFIGSDDIGKLASLYRALDIDPIISVRLLLMTSPILGRNKDVFAQVVDMFKKLDVMECQQQFIPMGARFSVNTPREHSSVDKSHFAKLVAERRRSVKTSPNAENNTGYDDSRKYSSAS